MMMPVSSPCTVYPGSAQLFNGDTLLFSLDDAGVVRDQVGSVFKPHELRAVRRGEHVSASMYHTRTGQFSVNRLEYMTDVLIDPGRLEEFYLIQIPLQGTAEIRCGDSEFESGPEMASLISPQLPLQMRWNAASPQLAIRINKEDMAYHCRQHLPQSCEQHTPVFMPELDLSSCAGRSLMQMVNLYVEAVLQKDHPLHNPLALRQYESALLNTLLFGLKSDADLYSGQRDQIASPYFVRRTEEFIREHLDEALNIEMLAEQAGVSVRTLHAGFRKFRQHTPMGLLRELRLDRVREELMASEHQSVTDVAFRWGFTHLGRFSQEYRRRFGESPSETKRFRLAP